MFPRSSEEINKLISKWLPNIYVNSGYWGKFSSQNFDFPSLKMRPSAQYLESSNSCRYHWILKPLAA